MTKKIYHIFHIILLACLFSSCAAIGSKTLYKTDLPIETDNWGIAPLESENQFYTGTSDIYINSITDSFRNYGLGKPVILNEFLSYDHSDSSEGFPFFNRVITHHFYKT